MDMLCLDAVQIETCSRQSLGEKSGQHRKGNILPFLKGLPVPGFCTVDSCLQCMPALGTTRSFGLEFPAVAGSSINGPPEREDSKSSKCLSSGSALHGARYHVNQGSSTPGPRTGTGPRPARNQATQQEVSSGQSFICRSPLLPVAPRRSLSLALPPEPTPYIGGKIVFHETGPWCQKGWGLLM